MVFIVMIERHRKALQCRSHIRFWHERDVVFLHRFHEPLGHAVTLWTAHCCCTGLQIQVYSELPRVMAVYAEPLSVNHCTTLVRECRAEAFFHGSWHHILHCCAVIAASACSPVYGFSVTAVQRERHPQFFAVITSELEAI